MDLNKAISKRIFELLEQNDWSAYKLSYLSAVPHSTISNLLLEKCRSCNLETILNVCRGFNISLGELFSSDMFSLENLNDN